MNVHVWSEHIAEGPGRKAEQSRLNLVHQAENLALASIDKRLNIAALSRMLVVSERTLRKAFRVTYGLSPCRHLRMLRLLQVRQVLMSSHNRAVTVTEAATCFGFVELGRFAVEYRKVFGESPSVTLGRIPCTPSRQRKERTYLDGPE